ncbi:MAG: sigma-70 family RNA polymerase sigma factor [Dehalococcoidia bacterium]
MEYGWLKDEQIIRLIVQGDKEALGALYDRYGRAVYSLSLRIMEDKGMAEEITQEVFLTAWARADTFHMQKGKFLSWLLTITHNKAIDQWRKRRRSLALSFDSVAANAWTAGEQGLETLEDSLSSVDRKYIREAVDRLPAPQKQVVTMAYFYGLTQSEIARQLGAPIGTVKTRMRLAFQKLKESLIQLEEELKSDEL